MTVHSEAFAVMFHHFWNSYHPRGQGAISAEELDELIGFIGSDRLVPAHEWQQRACSDQLEGWEISLSFDDGLRCQFDIALPVLEAHSLTAFWFVHTAPLAGEVDKLESYRFFRTTCFEDLDSFYEAFESAAKRSGHGEMIEQARSTFDQSMYLRDFPFYTVPDRWFRFMRDELLGPERYQNVMDSMIIESEMFDTSLIQRLWMSEDDLRTLDAGGHVVGLHSHTHPTRLDRLALPDQAIEYKQNLGALTTALGRAPTVMSHPCNAYTSGTLEILEDLGVKLGFRANMSHLTQRTKWEWPREDHANVVAWMNK